MTPERAQALKQKYDTQAAKTQAEGWKAEVRRIMKELPHTVFDIWSHAKKLAKEPLTTARSSGDGEPAPAAAAIEDGAPKEGVAGPDRAAEEVRRCAATKDAGNLKFVTKLQDRLRGRLDRRRMTLAGLGQDDLKAILWSIDEKVFSPWALRGLAPHGGKDASKVNMLESIEFLTDLPASWHFPDHFVCLSDVATYVGLQAKYCGGLVKYFKMLLKERLLFPPEVWRSGSNRDALLGAGGPCAYAHLYGYGGRGLQTR